MGIALAAAASAQQPVPANTPIAQDDGKDDIFFVVKLTAKELKMDVVPDSKVEFPGTHARATVWFTDRKNLPETLQPGMTYRDIGMTLRISSRFENIEEIVREALGEVTPPDVGPVNTPAAVPVKLAPAATTAVSVRRKPRRH